MMAFVSAIARRGHGQPSIRQQGRSDMDASARSPGTPQRESDDAGRHGRAIPRAAIAAAAFCMQLAFGAVYGWSVFLNPLREQFGASKPEANLTFTITLAVLGLTAGLGGSLQRRIGPRATATIAGLLYGSGVILSGFAPNLSALYLSYGVIGGIGLGFGYIVPLAVLIAWFPDRRGFITGLAVTGFGLGALVTSPLATELIRIHGVQSTLIILGTAFLLIAVAAAQVLRPAPSDYAPPGWTPAVQQASGFAAETTLRDALRTPHWYLLWSILALNVTAGAALISVAAPLAQELTQVGPALGAIAVCLISLFNGIGRLFWGAISDRLGRAATFLVMFLLQACAFTALPAVDQFWLLLVPAALIALCYGGGFGTMPAFATDVFGAKNAGTIYGAMLTAWSAGAIAGPLLIAALPYRTALPVIAGMLACAAILPVLFSALVQRGAATARSRPQRAAVQWQVARVAPWSRRRRGV
jgi:OFA family oxalate/formate antiporter-like MFS transporter